MSVQLALRVSVMKKLIALAFAGLLSSSTLLAAAPTGQAQAASLAGTASSSTGQTLVNATVQLRNLATGQLASTTTSNAVGNFAFAGLNPGNYAVEVVNAAGQIVGTSASITVAAGATVTGVSVTATAAVVAGGAGVGAGAAAGAAAAGGGAAAGVSTAAVVTAAATAAGVAGATAVTTNASPSR
jgi:hypothetical protein